MKLFDLAAEHLALADRLAETGELSAEDEAAIEANEKHLREKAAGYVAVWRTLDAEAEAMRAEARRLSEAAVRRENASKRLRDRLAWCLDTCGIRSLPTPLGKLSVSGASRPAFKLDCDAADLPAGLVKVTTDYRLDDKGALAAWKAGTLPAGVRAVVGRYVRVV